MTTDAFGTSAPRSRTTWRPRLRSTVHSYRMTAASLTYRASAAVAPISC